MKRSRIISLKTAKDFFTKFIEYRTLDNAAELTFYMIYSFFPVLIILSATVGMLNLDADWVSDIAEKFLPNDLIRLIKGYLGYLSGQNSVKYLLLGIVLSISSFNKLITTLRYRIRLLYPPQEKRGFFREWLLTTVMSVFVIVALYTSLLLFVFGETILNSLTALFDWDGGLYTLIKYFRYFVTLFILFVFLFSTYRFLPGIKLKSGQVLPGTLFSMAAWMLLSFLFAEYVNNMANYSLIYGSIGTIVILMTWMYLLSVVLLTGMQLNAFQKE